MRLYMALIRFMCAKELESFRTTGTVRSLRLDRKISFYNEYPYRGKIHFFRCFKSIYELFESKPDYMVIFRLVKGKFDKEVQKCRNNGTAYKGVLELEFTNIIFKDKYTNENLSIMGIYNYDDFFNYCSRRYFKAAPLSIYTLDSRRRVNTIDALSEFNLLKTKSEVVI